jgi:hypothetical protein
MVCKVFKHMRKLVKKIGARRLKVDNPMCAVILCHANGPQHPEVEALIRLGTGNHYRSRGGPGSVVHQVREAIENLQLDDEVESCFGKLISQEEEVIPKGDNFRVTTVFPFLKGDSQFQEELQRPWAPEEQDRTIADKSQGKSENRTIADKSHGESEDRKQSERMEEKEKGGRWVDAEYEYVSENRSFSMQQGDRLLVINDDDKEGWWFGRKQDGVEGYFPYNYVSAEGEGEGEGEGEDT